MLQNVRRFFSFLNGVLKKNTTHILNGESFRICFDGDVENGGKFEQILKEEIVRSGGTTITEEENETGILITGRLSVYGASKFVPSRPCLFDGYSELDFEQRRTSPITEIWVKSVVIDYIAICGKEALMAGSTNYTLYPLDNEDDERRKIAKQIIAEISPVMLA